MNGTPAEATSFSLRPATSDDAVPIARHRVHIFAEMGEIPSDRHANALLEASISALRSSLNDGTYKGWLALDPSQSIVGGAGLHVKPQLPRISPDRSTIESGPVPLVVNVYTEPSWRRRGIARALLNALLQWASAEGIDRVILHASRAGRLLYTAAGFEPTDNEMRWSPRRGAPDV